MTAKAPGRPHTSFLYPRLPGATSRLGGGNLRRTLARAPSTLTPSVVGLYRELCPAGEPALSGSGRCVRPQAAALFADAAARAARVSRRGGAPNMRAYSRLNWETLS